MNRKVLIIGLDGCRPDSIQAANTPNIDQIITNGAVSWKAQTEIRTISGAAWTSLLTGVHMDKHGVYGNDFKPRNLEYRTLYHEIKKWNPNFRVIAYSNWKPIITKIFEKGILSKKKSGSDRKMTKRLVKSITKDQGDLYFLQLDEIDGAGHKWGYGPDCHKYVETIEKRDLMLGQIIQAIKQRPDEEKWLIILVSDHGGLGHGHGKPTNEELTIIFAVSGTMVENNQILDEDEDEFISIVDAVPTIAKFLGMPQKEYWDGKIRGLE